MKETRWDCVEFTPPELPYRENQGLLDFNECLISPSADVMVNSRGTITKRFGAVDMGLDNITGRVVRTWVYETLPLSDYTPPHTAVYFLASVYDGTNYKLYWNYFPIGAESPSTSWSSSATDLRNMNTSKKPHIITFSKGLAYVKCFPGSGVSDDRYGTIILKGEANGTMRVYPWGVPGPTNAVLLNGDVTKLTAAATATDTTLTVSSTTGFPSPTGTLWIGLEKITYTGTTGTTFTGCTRGASGTKAEAYDIGEAVRNLEFDASDHQVEVKYGWQYAFAYVSITGQVSNRSDIQRNPDLMPSNTGPFADMNPKMTLTLDSFFYNDTTTYPYLNMYRTTDGGGTFYFLEQVANPGTSTLTYEDASFGTGASSTTYNDPVPDSKLDTARYAPSLTSNSPPTPVIPPQVMGTDPPSKDCWSMTTFAGRIWIAVSNYLFFSSREETRDGIGEECFPSGNLGNFFILDSGITGLAATDQSLYVGTTNAIWKLEGSTLDSFVINKQFNGVGVIAADNSMRSFNNNVAFISSTGIPAIIENSNISYIGREIEQIYSYTSWVYTSSIPQSINIQYYHTYLNEWLIFFVGNGNEGASTTIPSNASVMYIYDLKKSKKYNRDFWQPPWTTKVSSLCVGPYNSLSVVPDSRIFITSYNSVANRTKLMYYAAYPQDNYTDNTGSLASRAISSYIRFNLVRAPAGNHLNALSVPGKDVNLYGITCNYGVASVAVATPSMAVILDNKSSSESQSAGEYTPRIQYGTTNYQTIFYPFHTECQKVSLSLTDNTASKDIAVYSVTFMFDPKANP